MTPAAHAVANASEPVLIRLFTYRGKPPVAADNH